MRSFRTQVLLWIGLIVASSLIVLGFAMSAVNTAQLERVIDRGLLMRGDAMGRGNRPFPFGRPGGPVGAPQQPTGDLVVDLQRPVAMDLQGNMVQGREMFDPRARKKDGRVIAGFSNAQYRGEEIRVYTTALMRPRGAPPEGGPPGFDPPQGGPPELVGTVQVASDLRAIRQLKAIQIQTLLSTVPLAILGALVVAFFLAARVARPVAELGAAAKSLAEGDYSARLPDQKLEEFSTLGTQFNLMAERVETSVVDLQSALDQQRRFTADASHELRTPLTRMQLATSAAFSGSDQEIREALVVADTAAKDMALLVQQLLELAKADTGELTSNLVPLDLRVVVAEAIEKLGSNGVPLEIRLDDKAVPVMGDSSQLERVVFNLVENARRHTNEGLILVELYANGSSLGVEAPWHGAATLKVTDTGAGIAPEHLQRVTERFYRVDSARDREHGGSGLGLAIVQEIVTAHHGTLRIESEVDLGTVVTVAIPLK